MITILSAFVSVLSFWVRNRASLELELIASTRWPHGRLRRPFGGNKNRTCNLKDRKAASTSNIEEIIPYLPEWL